MYYEINWIDSAYINVKGKIGIGRAPGFLGNRDQDLIEIKNQNISKIYCLQEEDELAYLGNGETVKEREASLKELGIELVHSPIGDFRIPTVEQAKELCEMILNDIKSGKNILIHCMGGLGRLAPALS
ncbi:MAG: hypothetical protein KKD38_05440 [Candidatus Delongbacteria bacterium]|nr:hypothetical protein [Candidatus Delongbacteria bacterium]MCG2759910.1 hypothetical protein [Candidatus Delongbacteria bacterium]